MLNQLSQLELDLDEDVSKSSVLEPYQVVAEYDFDGLFFEWNFPKSELLALKDIDFEYFHKSLPIH